MMDAHAKADLRQAIREGLANQLEEVLHNQAVLADALGVLVIRSSPGSMPHADQKLLYSLTKITLKHQVDNDK